MGMTGEQAYVLAKKLIEAGGGGGGTVDAYTKTQTDNLLKGKVDKEDGKGLFSGSYNDLSDTPTIPTKTSELQNDSGYLTEQAVSDEWNDTTTYEVGQYCIFSNRLWKCLIQNSGEAPQEGTYWTQTSIDNEINELNSNLSNVSNRICSVSTNSWMNCPVGISMYHYEGLDTTEFNIPTPFVEILTIRYANHRGIAFAVDWRGDQPHQLWVNVLHDTWKSWVEK